MNNRMKSNLMLTFFLIALVPFVSIGQEEVKEKKKEVRIKTVKVEDGKKIVKDTTFTVKSGDEVKDVMKTIAWVDENDSTKTIRVDVEVDSDHGGEKTAVVKVIEGEDGEVNVFTIDSDHKGHKMIVKSKGGHHNVWHSKDADDNEVTYDIIMEMDADHDFDFDKEAMEKEMKVIKLHLDEANNVMLEELESIEEIKEVIVLKELEQLKELEHLEDLKELKEMEFHMAHPSSGSKHKAFFHGDGDFVFYEDCHGVSQKEMRDAGIKSKPDKLEVEDFDMNISKGIVDLEFTLKTEGAPKVVVYNYFGDKVFSGKAEMIGSVYKISIDMSAKQDGKYYVQLVQKNRSFTDKFSL